MKNEQDHKAETKEPFKPEDTPTPPQFVEPTKRREEDFKREDESEAQQKRSQPRAERDERDGQAGGDRREEEQ